MSRIRLFQNAKLILRSGYPLFYSSFTNARRNYHILLNVTQANFKLCVKSAKYISNCSLMHTSDSSREKSNDDDEKVKKILEDKEFQSILQDFANDFGVDSETNELLDDIRKNIDGSTNENNLSTTSSNSDKESIVLSNGLHQTFKEFSDADASVIPSYEEKYEMFEENEPMYHISHEVQPRTHYTDLKRGVTGVFDIDELIQVLRNESMLDVTTISIPKELHYADFLVLATAKSERHSNAVSELLRKLHKRIKSKKDPFLKIEGEDVPEWKAIDMGNIVLHIFLEETRNLYDIESLWLLDSKFDSGGNALPDPMLSVLEEQMSFFNSLQEQNSNDLTKNAS